MAKLRLVLQASHVRRVQPELQQSDLTSQQEADSRYLAFWAKFTGSPMAGRHHIVTSVCSQLSGLFDVKLALLLVLLGGMPTQNGSASTRGEPHMLLVGDPGTGKSQIMKYAAKLAPRCGN
jgi:DNA helicase MCM9